MLALVRKHKKIFPRLLFLASLTVLGACATEKEPPRLVNDPDSKPESALPWNKQEKWEVGAGVPDQLREGR